MVTKDFKNIIVRLPAPAPAYRHLPLPTGRQVPVGRAASNWLLSALLAMTDWDYFLPSSKKEKLARRRV